MGDDNGDNASRSGPDRRAANKSLALEIQSEGVKMPANHPSSVISSAAFVERQTY